MQKKISLNGYKNCFNNTSSLQNETIKNMQESLVNDFNTTSIDNGDDFIITGEKITYTVTTTKNQERQTNENKTTINLGNCETKLKEEYKIFSNDSLYILMVDIFEDNIHRIEYEVYYNFSLYNLTKLNLTSCKDIRIDISSPRDIPNNEIDKYNKSSGFYNDICYTLTSDDGTDKPLYDRQNEYELNNLSVCEDGCDFTSYNDISRKVVCSCSTKLSMPLLNENKPEKKNVFSDFKNINNIGNFKMLTCINLLFNISNVFNNISNYMLIILIVLNVISVFVFVFHDKRKIKQLINSKKKKKNSRNKKNNLFLKMAKKTIKTIKFKKKKKNKKKIKNEILMSTNNTKEFIKINVSSNNRKLKISKNNEYELNNLTYKNALKEDKRNFLQIYKSFIKTKHPFIFSFFHLKDYNSQTLKIHIFFFTFATNLVVSAMFYSDFTMHKIYIDEGLFDFIYQLPQMIYSFIISTIIENFLNHLGLYEEDIATFIKFKIFQNNKMKLLSKINIKIIIFFITNCILLFLYWIYLGCFCAVYKNTQIHLLIDVLSSLAISLITPFIFILLPCIFRVLSLRDKHGKRRMLFKLSYFLLNF